MPTSRWLLNKGAPEPRPSTAGAAAPPPPAASRRAEALPIDLRALVAGWRPAEALVRLETTSSIAPGRRVALKLERGTAQPDPVLGTVKAVNHARGRRVVDVQVDGECTATLQRQVDLAQGRTAPPRPRAPRYRVALPAAVSSPGGTHLSLRTSTLSLGGCSLAWNGHHPLLGAQLGLRLGSGPSASSCRGRVCWVRPEATGFRVGVRFMSSDQLALAALIRKHAEVEPTD